MATSVPQRIPFRLPRVPRVRPPPIPKGTPGPNTLPVPAGRIPRGLTWADGKWRRPNSRSALHKSQVVSRQLEKALQHEVHGMNIFAYKHFNTGSVVYSLTNHMDENQILKQLLFHGKQTVAAELRRDEWHPYFSVHFPETPSGAAKGLRVYQDLRELSMKRQLDPPKYLTHDIRKKSYVVFEKVEDADGKITRRKTRKNMTIVGSPLPQSKKAKNLMSHQATSVADLAAALQRQTDGKLVTPLQDLILAQGYAKEREGQLSSRAVSRLAQIRSQETRKEKDIQQRALAIKSSENPFDLDSKTLNRIAVEYHGTESGDDLHMLNMAGKASAQERQAYQTYLRECAAYTQNKSDTANEIEIRMMAEIDQELSQLTQSEQDKVRADIKSTRSALQKELDDQILQIQAEHRKQRQQMRAGFRKIPSKSELAKTHEMKQQHAEQIREERSDAARHLKFVGPYAKIDEAIRAAEGQITTEWESRAEELRKAIAEELQTTTDPDLHTVIVNWANLGDGLYARHWPTQVKHGKLEPKAAIMRGPSSVHYFGYTLPDPSQPDGFMAPRYLHASMKSQGSDERRMQRIKKDLSHTQAFMEYEQIVQEQPAEQ